MQSRLFWVFTFITFCLSSSLGAAELATSAPSSQPAATWQLKKAKNFPLWKVEIFTKENPQAPLGIEASKALIKNPDGTLKVEIKDIILEPDPKENIQNWVPGTLLDLDKDSYEDLVLKGYSAGAHCCFTYQIFSLGKVLKKLAELPLFDCGESIELKDLDAQGPAEILTCNAKFAYLKGIPYSSSPFPPQVFAMENGKYKNADKKFLQVFDEDIAEQRQVLSENYDETAIIQLVLDYLLSGREEQAWQEFDKLHTGANKEVRRKELKDRWNLFTGAPAETKKAETQIAPSTGGKLP